MAGFTATAWIAAQPAEIFDFVLDVENFSTVLPSVTHAEKITDGPVGLGTRFRETRLFKGREATSEIEVTAYDLPHSYSATSSQSGITATYRYTFTHKDGGTQVDLDAAVSANGVKKLMLPVVVGFMKKEDGDHLQHLKHAVEEARGR